MLSNTAFPVFFLCSVMPRRHHTRNDDDEQQHNYAHDDPDPHLHVLPPHLLADPIGATAETLGGLIEVLGFVLELVDVFATLGDGFEVLFHDVDSVVDLRLNCCSPCVATLISRASTLA